MISIFFIIAYRKYQYQYQMKSIFNILIFFLLLKYNSLKYKIKHIFKYVKYSSPILL